jgi:hypothetical protein
MQVGVVEVEVERVQLAELVTETPAPLLVQVLVE